MNIIITGGGTAGHVNPLIAIVKYISKREKDVNVLFVGTENGIEKKLALNEGYQYKSIEIKGLMRSISPKALLSNLKTSQTTIKSLKESRKIIDEFKPDVIICGGGYVSFPVTYAGIKAKIKTIVLEVNLVPGLTTKMLSKKCSKVLLAFSDTKKHLDKKTLENTIVSGAPTKEEFKKLSKLSAKRKLNMIDKPLVLSFWGSVGAKYMNEKMVEFVLEKDNSFYHVHSTGSGAFADFKQKVKGCDTDIYEYIYNMDEMMAAADIVISRAGASTLSELALMGKPSIIVPSPYVAENHQEKNARVLEKSGACVLLLEQEISGKDLLNECKALINDYNKLESLSSEISKFGNRDSNEIIYKTVLELIN